MANSFVRYTGNGSTTSYAIPFSYISSSHLSCTVNGVSTSFTLNAAGTIATFSSAPANASSIEFRRATSQNARLTDYVSGAVLTETDLDTDSTQGFMLGQEAIDDAADKISLDSSDFQWNANSKRIKNVAAPTADTDVVNKAFISTNLPNITTVSGIASDVTTVAGIQANVTTVAGNNANVTTVASNIASVNTVAGDITKVVAVANDLAETVSEIETVANDLNETTSEIDTVAASIANVDTVGTNIANVNTVAGNNSNINTVAGISANVTSVAGIASNVTAVAGNATNINAVNSNSSNINTVAGNNSNVSTVAGISGNVTTVAGISSDVTAVAADATDIGAVAAKATEIGRLGTADAVADMNTLGTADIVTDMNLLATSANVTNMATLGASGVVANIATVAGNNSNISTVAGISSNVTTVAGDSSEIGTVAGNTTNINTVAGANSNISTVAGSISNVNTVASNISGVNSFGERYRVGSSYPASSNDAGDLAFNTAASTFGYYDGSNWQSITAGGITSLAGDATPQLGGNLDLNSNNITGTGDINITGGVTMSGNLTVNGTTTTINSTTMTVDDKNMVLASGAADSAAANDAGITIDGASATLKYSHTGTKWTVNKDFDVTGNIIVSGTVDGRDLQTDGTKLDAIEASATADQTGAEIKSAYEGESDTNAFTDALLSKLNGIEASATADQTNAEIRTAVEAASDSNVFTDADHTKLNGIEASADVTDATNVTAAGALMDSEVTNLAQVKAFSSADYATAAQGTTADAALPKAGGTMTGDLTISDNDDIIFGAGGDLKIRHDATDNNSYIDENGSGSLIVRANNLLLKKYTGETYVNCVADGAVTLYYDNASKLATASGGVSVTGDMTASGNVTAYSDERLKDNIKTIDNALDKVSQMRGVTFTKDDKLSSGVIAQEMEKIAPELVMDGEYKSVAYGNTVGYLIEAIKELKSEIDNHKAKCNCGDK